MADWRPAAGWSRPEPGGLDLWRIELSLREDDWALLTAEEAALARRIVIPRKSRQKAAARASLRRILAHYVAGAPGLLRFSYGEHGKPALLDDPGLSFNLSHSEHLALLGVSTQARIGVDIEHTRPARAFEAIAARFFSPPEHAYLEKLPVAERPAAFYRAWTRKEAYLKAWGTGLSFSSRRFTIDYRAGRPGRVLATQMPDDDPMSWRFLDVAIDPGFCAAACIDREPSAVRWFSG
jgi:4'-phosphopantetheinyl transferase